MGTLRIKRGTKTQLQTSPGYTPSEGELVYTTDSKEVFVGDGTTVGGTPVSVSTQNLEDLGNVQALAAQKDQILVYNGSNWAATDNPSLDLRGNIYGDDSTLLVDAINGQIVGPVNTTSVVSSGNIVGDLVGDVTGSLTGNVIGDTTGTHFGDVQGSLTGDVSGSIFADDSSLLVDAVNGKLTGNIDAVDLIADNGLIGQIAIAPIGGTNQITTLDTNLSTMFITMANTNGTIAVTRKMQIGSPVASVPDAKVTLYSGLAQHTNIEAIGVYDNDTTQNHGIAISRARGATKDSPTALASGDGLGSFTLFGYNGVGYRPSGGVRGMVSGTPQSAYVPSDIELYVSGAGGAPDPVFRAKSADKVGEFLGPLKLASYTATERNALTPEEGWVIFNTTDSKAQIYANGAWRDMHTS
jgi:hypothetical protein